MFAFSLHCYLFLFTFIKKYHNSSKMFFETVIKKSFEINTIYNSNLMSYKYKVVKIIKE